MKDMVLDQKIKNITAMVLSLLAGAILAIYTKSWTMFGAGVFIASYFLMQFLNAVSNAKKGKYTQITALAVAADQSRDGMGVIETWRFIPVDENGNYIDENGKYDIFLRVKPKDRNYHIGGTYVMLFCAEPGEPLNQEKLIAIEQKEVTTQKEESVPVQEIEEESYTPDEETRYTPDYEEEAVVEGKHQ